MTSRHRASDTRTKILNSAARRFRSQGYLATTVRQVADDAGMLLGSLQYRYARKEGLLIAVMESAVERTTDAIRQAIAGKHRVDDRLRAAMTAYLETLWSGNDALYVLLYDWRSLKGGDRERAALLHDRLFSLFDGLFYEAAGAGFIAADIDIPTLRDLWLGALNWTADHPPNKTAEQISDLLWTILTEGAAQRRVEQDQ
ncbi:TetR/AcrR family transcriptional regulator [Mycolicibacter algericus]|nr:TetR/AcrR family transcriptional regulator [Mycolicibacter algericus]